VTALAILALLAAACYVLFRMRPFKTCPSCKGYGSKSRILGGTRPLTADVEESWWADM